MIVLSTLSKIKNKILSTCLQGNYRDSLGEFVNTSYICLYSVFEGEKVKMMLHKLEWKLKLTFLRTQFCVNTHIAGDIGVCRVPQFFVGYFGE